MNITNLTEIYNLLKGESEDDQKSIITSVCSLLLPDCYVFIEKRDVDVKGNGNVVIGDCITIEQ